MRHTITQIATHENGGTYKVTFRIPWVKGWIDGEKVKFYVWRFENQQIFDMHFIKNEDEHAYFETIIKLENCTLYQYYFSFVAEGRFQYYKRENFTGDTNVTRQECFKMSVNFNVPEWAKGCVAYQIFPDRFNKGKCSVKNSMPRRRLHQNWDEQPIIGPDEEGLYNTDFFGGDFLGIKEKIPYLADLGVDLIYLNPIVTSQSNHRYDTGDYFHPDPYLGTNEELKDMIQEFHEYGIKVILDGVYNHTGNDSLYFNEYGTYDSVGAYQSKQSPYSEIYEKNESGEFSYWWNFKTLPVCNKYNQQFIKMICGESGVIDLYCKLGADGIRIDVADELPDYFMVKIWEALQRNKPNDFLVILEVWENAMRKGKTYLSNVREGHTPMNYFLMDGLIGYYKYGDVYQLDDTLRQILTEYPTESIQTAMNSTSTHDMSRLIEIYGCDDFNLFGEHKWDIDWHGMNEEQKNKWLRNHKLTQEQYNHGKLVMKSYVTALAFLPGMFTIFYGDEVGVQGIGNLLNRATYPWGHEDKELLEFYKKLIKSRKSEEFLRKADTRILKIDQNKFVFERYDDNNQVIVIASRVNDSTEISIPKEYENAQIIFSTEGNSYKTLAPYGAIVLKK